ncbi:alpha/beta hydrolase [Schumannella sp. 10F1B-5-1]|uniref:alpha/beta hydrolase n=1 Tax=Schumannella sp. 10F1B-5-1 TaxID=2590780 RepID=UPI002105E4D4|nr:alpha/beta hydrolase fold domain-containing protein [Schumannella sp. 10F1B-5-1]
MTHSTPPTHVIVLPGGGYSHHAEHEGEPVVAWLRGLGMRASTFLYPVATRHPAVLDAVRAEVRRVREQWAAEHESEPGDGASASATSRAPALRVGVLGFSAGGHAAGHAAYAPLDAAEALARGLGPELAPGSDPSPLGRPDFAVLAYPVVSMLTKTHAGSRRNLLGDGPSDEATDALDADADADAADRYDLLRASTSLERLVTPGAPPAFVWHTAEDAVVPVGHAYRLGRALASAKVPHELHVWPHGPHGLGLATGERFAGEAVRWTEACERWLRAEGWLA